MLLHELGHSVVALRYKIPVRSITLFIFGGVAQIGAEPPSADRRVLIAIAGPLVSFALAVFFYAFSLWLPALNLSWGWPSIWLTSTGTLVLFNLIPGFPLDGGRVFRAIVWAVTHNMRRATLIAANVGPVHCLLVHPRRRLADVQRQPWQRLVDRLHRLVPGQRRFGPGAASDVQDLLADHQVSQAMSTHGYAAIPAELTLQQLVDDHILGGGRRCFLVNRGDETVGLMTLHRDQRGAAARMADDQRGSGHDSLRTVETHRA